VGCGLQGWGVAQGGHKRTAAARRLNTTHHKRHAPRRPTHRPDLTALPQRLELLRQATRALAYAHAAGVPLHAPPPDYPSRAVWQRAVAGRRAAQAGGHMFLDDLLDALQRHEPPLRPPSPQKGAATRTSAAAAAAAGAGYPWASPAAAVEALFGGDGSGGDAAAARCARLALLFYFLKDGGWVGSSGIAPASFARAFDLQPGLVAQWEAQQLLDHAAGGGSGDPQQQQHLTRACDLLLGCANASTTFRLVEALVAAGCPAQALSVQRARGGAASSAGGLHEARVLMAARLECGLLHEAHAGVTLHCAQLPSAHARTAHLEALMGQLLEWAGGRDDARRTDQAAAAGGGGGGADAPAWLQQVVQLPLGSDEERVVEGWLGERAAKGASDGDLLPLYLLQVRCGCGGAVCEGLGCRGGV